MSEKEEREHSQEEQNLAPEETRSEEQSLPQEGQAQASQQEEATPGQDLKEQVQEATTKIQAVSQAISNAVSVLINPATWIALGVGLLALVLIAGGMATFQALGQNPNACSEGEDCAVVCPTGAGLTGATNAEKIYNYLQSKGYPAPAAAGIAGNFAAESSGEPWKAEIPGVYVAPLNAGTGAQPGYVTGFYRRQVGTPNVGGWGIAQWSFTRHKNLRDYVIENLGPEYYVSQLTDGDNPLSPEMSDQLLAAQLDFMISGEPAYAGILNEVKAAATPELAATIFMRKWERPANESSLPQRMEVAREIYNSQGGSVAPVAAGGSGSNCAPTSSGVMPPILQARWDFMYANARTNPGAVPWRTYNFGSSWHYQCPKVVDIIYGGPGRGAISSRGWGTGNGWEVVGKIMANDNYVSAGSSNDTPVDQIPPGAVLSWPAGYLGGSYGHTAVYDGNGNIWTNDIGCPGQICEAPMVGKVGANYTWVLPSEAFDLGGAPPGFTG